jgi:hypothetical protein
MPTVFNSEEERLAYLISLNSTDAMRQLKEFIASSNSSVEALERLTKVTMEYAKVAKISFNSAKMSMAELNAAYKQAVASGNALVGGSGGAGGLGGGVPPLDPNVFRQGASFGGAGGIGGINSTLKEIPSNSDKAKSALSSLATTFKHVIVGMLAFRVIQFFMDIVTGIGAATAAAKDFYKSLVNVQMGVMAMRRAGEDVSLSTFVKAIADLRKELPVLSTPELTDGLDNILLKTSQMGLAWEETITILKVAAATQAVTGKQMESVSDAIINAMVSSQGSMTKTLLEQTNIQVNAQDILNQARENGVDITNKAVSDLSKEERAAAVLAFTYEQLLLKLDEINASMGTSPSKIDAVTASWTDLKTQIGMIFLSMKAQLAPIILKILDSIISVFPQIVSNLMQVLKMFGFINSTLYGIVVGVNLFFSSSVRGVRNLGDAIKLFWSGFTSGFNEAQGFFDNVTKEVGNLVGGIESSFGTEGSLLGAKLAQTITDAVEEGLTADQTDALDEFARTVEQMALDIQRQLEQDTIDLNRKFAELNAEYERDVLSMYEDYNRDVADANESAIQSVADANAEYRDNELKEERDYQNKLQRLKDEFLFDMEDALRERDARQILRLMRRYQLDKKNIVRDGDDQREERRRNLAEELADIEKQRLRKLEDLAQELVYKKQKLYDDWQQNRTDTQLRFDQDQEDEKVRNTNKLKDLVNALAEQGLATQAGAEAIRVILMTYFGPGGYTEAIYKYLIAQITAAAKAMLMLNSIAGAMGGGSGGGTKPGTAGGNQPRQFASGGAMIASRPTTAVFGEGGEPELAVFLPLSKIRNPTARTSPNVGGAGGGRIKLDVTLSPDLEARIIQQASDNVATTITRIQREK